MSRVILGWAVLINGSSKPTKNHLNLSQNLRIGFILLKTFEIDHFCSDCRNNFLTMPCFVKTPVISVQVWNYVLFCGHQQMCLCYTWQTYSQTYMYLSHFMSYLFPIMSQVLSHIFVSQHNLLWPSLHARHSDVLWYCTMAYSNNKTAKHVLKLWGLDSRLRHS